MLSALGWWVGFGGMREKKKRKEEKRKTRKKKDRKKKEDSKTLPVLIPC